MAVISINEEKAIWNLLMKSINNPYGVAAVMGNLKAESGMDPTNMTGSNAKKWTSEKYINDINSGALSKYDFSHDGIAFGLVQWCYWSRKEALYDFARWLDISDPTVQIDFMLNELPKYKTVWYTLCNAKTIREASDSFMLRYEQPANITEVMKQRRERYSQEYYDKYAEGKKEDPKDILCVRTTFDKVLVRCGNGKSFSSFTRIEKSGSEYPYVATAMNGWQAITIGDRVGWISPEFSEIIRK